jgi:hypothetical protein
MSPRASSLRATQLVLVFLAAGMLVLTTAAALLRGAGLTPANLAVARVLPWIVVALAAAEMPAYLVLRRTLLARACASRDEALALAREGRIPGPLHALALVGAALAEGVGFLGLVALVLGASWYVLAAPLLAAALILAQVPTAEGVRRAVREG